jgi:hypothetical protein
MLSLKRKFILPLVLMKYIMKTTLIWTTQIPIKTAEFAGMYRVLLNIQDGAVSLEFSL